MRGSKLRSTAGWMMADGLPGRLFADPAGALEVGPVGIADQWIGVPTAELRARIFGKAGAAPRDVTVWTPVPGTPTAYRTRRHSRLVARS